MRVKEDTNREKEEFEREIDLYIYRERKIEGIERKEQRKGHKL
jgi:hypothetical protein